MNTFVIPIVTLTLMALLGVFVLRNNASDEDEHESRRVEVE